MNYKQIIDPIVFLQAHFAILFMERHGLQPKEFLELQKEKDILGFLRLGYQPFHLTGDEGVLEELDAYVFSTPLTHQKQSS
ncbi:MAG: DUF3791 domain-containing protein [Oscillospiraceae bacterium]|jgi:hypothetical protein|nr:DUF3791 domain-containing protein [Oscillospiraceae bacterium]